MRATLASLSVSYLAFLQTVLCASPYPDIYAYRYNTCIEANNVVLARCYQVPPNVCCGFPPTEIVGAVYVGRFTLPGGVGSWFYPGPRSSCGRVRDSAGDSSSVCMTDDSNDMFTMDEEYGGGASWIPVRAIDPAKTRSGSVVPNIPAPAGYSNYFSVGSNYKRDMEPRTDSDPTQITHDEWVQMMAADPALQCTGGTVYPDIFGWETGTTGVWVLENVTEAQYQKLASFPKSKDEKVVNGYLEAVGATHYDSYEDHGEALELYNKMNGKSLKLLLIDALFS